MVPDFPYKTLSQPQLIKTINTLAGLHQPFLFVIDYIAQHGYVIRQSELDAAYVQFAMPDFGLFSDGKSSTTFTWNINPIPFVDYNRKHNFVQSEIHRGNSFLVNLTQPTPIATNLSLLDFFQVGVAKYKLWINGQFSVLSPETFVRIEGSTICSFPMKGTIDATLPNAETIILNDTKEKAEHATIVDLIRNDLSRVSNSVTVKRYRYVEKLHTNKHDLLQVSSEITGQLPADFHQRLGDIFFQLLPAGSICGAPKKKTLEIIEHAEGYDRGFYTGIFGWFDGDNLDSAVMIRFLEQAENGLVFKSGGGITSQSNSQKEYDELIQKVYVPIS